MKNLEREINDLVKEIERGNMDLDEVYESLLYIREMFM